MSDRLTRMVLSHKLWNVGIVKYQSQPLLRPQQYFRMGLHDGER